jgi:hypothetical protein
MTLPAMSGRIASREPSCASSSEDELLLESSLDKGLSSSSSLDDEEDDDEWSAHIQCSSSAPIDPASTTVGAQTRESSRRNG